MKEPAWYPQIAKLLAGGGTMKSAAKAAGISTRTLRRHLSDPAGPLSVQVERARAERAKEEGGDELAPLRAQALAVLGRAMAGDSVGDAALSAARSVLTKTVASPGEAPQADGGEPDRPERTPEQSCGELAMALRDLPALYRLGVVSRERLEAVREAARALLADDLAPLPAPDLEEHRVQAAPELPELPGDPTPAAGGAAVIPIR